MKDKILNVGIAGYGTVGKIRHRFIDKHPSMKIVAVCDLRFKEDGTMIDIKDLTFKDRELLENPSHDLIYSGTMESGVRFCNNYMSLLEYDPLDILFICLPNYLAPRVTIAALNKGLHVFCEKPPGRNLRDVANVIAYERKCPGQKLMYGFNHRYHDSVMDAMKIIEKKELGDLLSLRGVYGKSKIIKFDSDWRTKRYMSGGGILLDQGIHMVDMMRLFAGEFSDIYSFISNDYWKHDVEDNAYILMRTGDGVTAMLHSSATQWNHMFQLSINLTKGAINLSGILSNTKSYAPETISVIFAGANDEGDPREQTSKYNEDKSWYREIAEFVDIIINDRPVTKCSSHDAFKTMELVNNIYKADQQWSKMFDI